MYWYQLCINDLGFFGSYYTSTPYLVTPPQISQELAKMRGEVVRLGGSKKLWGIRLDPQRCFMDGR